MVGRDGFAGDAPADCCRARVYNPAVICAGDDMRQPLISADDGSVIALQAGVARAQISV
jgi:hypothetical protein